MLQRFWSQNCETSQIYDYIQYQIDSFNRLSGSLEGYNCSICNNKGKVAFLYDNDMAIKNCACISIRNNLKNIEESGLKDLINNCTFDNFNVTEEWQKQLKELAQRYTEDKEIMWFNIGGQVGCGKTHICTAITSYYMSQHKTAKYMLWRDDAVRIKGKINTDAYDRELNKLKNVKVLYIDDLFKSDSGRVPTAADVNLAFEILNYRYNNKKLRTIISSEFMIDELLEIDEALGSRIYQRTKDYCIFIGRDKGKNYRLK